MRFAKLLVLSMTLAALVLPQQAGAKTDYPTKPITCIVGWAGGAGTDLICRMLMTEAGPYLAKPISIKNMEGGSGATAYTYLAKQKPDGYTIGINTATLVIHKMQGIIPIDFEEFEPIIGVNVSPMALWVQQEAPWKTLDDFIQHVKKNPGEVTVASSNPGSTTTLALSAFEQAHDLKLRAIAQKGGTGKGMVVLAGGHVDSAIAEPSVGAALAKAGKIRMLALMHSTRLKAIPDVPTFAEAGYPVEGGTFRMMVAPKGTPKEIVNILYEAFNKAARSEKYVNFIENDASGLLYLNPEECKAYLREARKSYETVLKSLGLYKPAG